MFCKLNVNALNRLCAEKTSRVIFSLDILRKLSIKLVICLFYYFDACSFNWQNALRTLKSEWHVCACRFN